MKQLFYLLLFTVIFSCREEKIKKPKDLIEKDKMIDLILDMKIADKAKSISNKNKKKNLNYMGLIYEKYHIDSTQFKESNDYYTEHLESYQEIYETVQKRLKDSVAKYKKVKKINDSIKREKKKKHKPKINKNIPINTSKLKRKVETPPMHKVK